MPLISSFLGILVYMFMEKGTQHHKPHIPAVYGEYKLSIAFDGEVLAGSFPKRQLKYLEAWIALREDELRASWTALNENGEVVKIRGLEG